MTTDAFPACDVPAAPLDGEWPERAHRTLVQCAGGLPVPWDYDCAKDGCPDERCETCPARPGL